MKYSSRNLDDPAIRMPLPFPVKLIVEYRPDGVLADSAPTFYSADPEGAVDAIVREKGWDRRPDYHPLDVWVNAGF